MYCHTIDYRGYIFTPSPISSLLTLIYGVNALETFKKKCQQTLLTAVLTLFPFACRLATAGRWLGPGNSAPAPVTKTQKKD
jgi:hypothetical protein